LLLRWPFVLWARLYLARHDLLETLLGASLCLLGGLVTAL